MDRNEQTLQILMDEYRVLKAEQSMRIGFRDNLLYVTLGLFGAIASFAFTNTQGYNAFLVIPWVCLVMGWTYLINDEKISAIGRYVRHTLEKRISDLIGGSADEQYLFGWETAHRDDPRRKRRKYTQLVIDQITFVVSGLMALIVFWILASTVSAFTIILSAIEAIFLIILGLRIADYADLAKGH
ncbi:hypothetical protein IQ260_01305 [Leptolyngbya cf. ectocarpi LEGE 11479]|uniref:Integral membrane protein n=1 Tax=Leptolyngbya cf. ectocarpi LEGE 11479 TaxID=1828722 RepID=A0A928X0J1_LEPEC|nr:hypothetical protein [Leptolyngbya ectocarpi]MBE9065284.1 hypothetical protein [Leptolyngbya cf. ectocarpi LEGE 11479]